MGGPGLGDLTLAGADLALDLGLHDLGGDHRHALAQEVGVLVDQRLGYDPGARHALALGHRGAPSSVDLQVNRRVWGPRWPELRSGPYVALLVTPLLAT